MNVDRREILAAVIECVAETLGIPKGEITEDTLIREELHADSMDIVTLMILLDDTFDAEFKPEDIPEKAVSVRWVADYISEKMVSSSAA